MTYISETDQRKSVCDCPRRGAVKIHYHDYVEDNEESFLAISVAVDRLSLADYGAVLCIDDQGRERFLGAYFLPKAVAMAHHIAEDISDPLAMQYTIRKYHIYSTDDDKAVDLE